MRNIRIYSSEVGSSKGSFKAAECIGINDFKLRVGAPAHLVVLDAPSILEALRYHEASLHVISHGKLVDQ